MSQTKALSIDGLVFFLNSLDDSFIFSLILTQCSVVKVADNWSSFDFTFCVFSSIENTLKSVAEFLIHWIVCCVDLVLVPREFHYILNILLVYYKDQILHHPFIVSRFSFMRGNLYKFTRKCYFRNKVFSCFMSAYSWAFLPKTPLRQYKENNNIERKNTLF